VADPNHREAIHHHPEYAEILEATGGQRVHVRKFVLKRRLAPAIPPGEDRPQKLRIVRLAVEVALAPEQQRLLDRPLEPVMGLFHIAILMAAAGHVRVWPHPIVIQHLPIPLVEGPAAFAQVMGGGRQIVRPVDSGHPSQFPDRCLKPGDQRLETLGHTERAGLPVRVREDEVIEEVIERLAVERDAQRPHGREIALRVFARSVDLREHHLPLGPVGGPPASDPALQRAELAVGQGPLGPSPAGSRRSWWPRVQAPGPTALQSPATPPPRDRGASDTAAGLSADWGVAPFDTAGPCSHSSLPAWRLLKVVCRCQVPSSVSLLAGR
jgi:hypothetical protein